MLSIHPVKLPHPREDQQQGDQRAPQLARDAGLDLQADQRARTQASQDNGHQNGAQRVQPAGKGHDQSVEVVHRREGRDELVMHPQHLHRPCQPGQCPAQQHGLQHRQMRADAGILGEARRLGGVAQLQPKASLAQHEVDQRGRADRQQETAGELGAGRQRRQPRARQDSPHGEEPCQNTRDGVEQQGDDDLVGAGELAQQGGQQAPQRPEGCRRQHGRNGVDARAQAEAAADPAGRSRAEQHLPGLADGEEAAAQRHQRRKPAENERRGELQRGQQGAAPRARPAGETTREQPGVGGQWVLAGDQDEQRARQQAGQQGDEQVGETFEKIY